MSEQISSLPVEKKTGQLFFIGLPDVELSDASVALLKEVSPGGICLFSRNIKSVEQVRRLVSGICETLPVAPFVSLDQEGGVVDRLRRILTPMPSASSFKSADEARAMAQITAEVVRMFGFNMNFAPVVDVIDDERAKFSNGLYSRAFGESKEAVADFAGAYLETLQAAGCLGCLKHFPGLGASAVDSHEELPVVQLTREELFAIDLLPYRRLIPTKQVHCIMIAHASFPHFDLQETDENGKLLPSSLSFNIVTRLLREELGFQGLTITDDLEMGAIVKNYGVGEACRKAISAGVDMSAICANADAVREGFNAVSEAVQSGEIAESRIDESLRRIAHLKSIMKAPLPFDAERLRFLSDEIARLNNQGG